MDRWKLNELRRDAELGPSIAASRVLELIAAFEDLQDDLMDAEDEIEVLVRDAAEGES